MSQESSGKSQYARQTATCWKCQLVCKNKQGLSVHQNKCLSNVSKEAPSTQSVISTEVQQQGDNIIADGPSQQVQEQSIQQLDRQTINPSERPNGQHTEAPLQETVPVRQNLAPGIWGNHSADDLNQIISAIYEEVVFWRKNLFKLPSGAAGKSYITETTKLITMWNERRKPMFDISLKMVMIMPALLLQKPTNKSNAKQHVEYLKKRIDHWKEGNFDELVQEGRAIQNKLKQQIRKDETTEHMAKVFAKLMMEGKVHAALRLLSKAESLGVADLTPETMQKLADLHPNAIPASESVLKTGELPYFDPICIYKH